jgi:hypothetical protein
MVPKKLCLVGQKRACADAGAEAVIAVPARSSPAASAVVKRAIVFLRGGFSVLPSGNGDDVQNVPANVSARLFFNL